MTTGGRQQKLNDNRRRTRQHKNSLVVGAEETGLPAVLDRRRCCPTVGHRQLGLQFMPLHQQLLHDPRPLCVLVLQAIDAVLHLADFVQRNLNVLALEGLDALGES